MPSAMTRYGGRSSGRTSHRARPDEELDRELVQLLLNRTPLTPRQIDIFYRHYWKDETFASMASELGLPVDEVRTLHTYALEKLKRTSAAR